MEFTRNNNLPQKGDKLFIREQIGTSWLPTGVDDLSYQKDTEWQL